jgi:D-alanyl-lipoteichoic acid acyltransferase DltB (MBOAT superfamily)
MLFATFDFLLFFVVAFAVYWALSGWPKCRALWVVLTSYFFYMAGPKPLDGPLPTPWYFAGLLALSTLVDYVCGLRITAAQQRALAFGSAAPVPSSPPERSPGSRPGRAWLVVSLCANLGLLAYFKYTGFMLQVISDAAALLGTELVVPTFKVLLPLGISFYTFQSLSYTVDVYRGRIAAERNLLRFALFLAFFPQLVAGPIVRASEFLPQLRQRPSLTSEDVDFAVWRITKGVVKKIVFADFIAASFTDRVFAAPAEYSSLENLLALYAFTLQIYADFSGYSDIAIGAARLLGFRLPENFARPYQAVDVSDFWRRWHITLSSWLRDYVYYPLGGSRGGAARTCLNLWLTLFLVGIWHGASWNFVIYATLQACAMVYNRLCGRREGFALGFGVRLLCVSGVVLLGAALFGKVALELVDPWPFAVASGALALGIGLLPHVERWPALRIVHVLLTLHFAVFCRVFFRADSLSAARAMISKLMEWDGTGIRRGLLGNEALSVRLGELPALSWAEPAADWVVLMLLVLGFALHYVPARAGELVALGFLPRVPGVLVGAGLAALLGVLSLLLAGPRANIYFAF